MKKSIPTVFIVDDDPDVREGLARLIKSEGFCVKVFATSEEFLLHAPSRRQGCLVLDVCMPGLNGIDLQKELAQRGIFLPCIFITGHGDIPMGIQAMKDGAVDFLPKPFEDTQLLYAIEKAIERDSVRRRADTGKAEFQRRLETLTPREGEVLRWVIKGMLNKQIARKLKIAEQTIKIHRGRAMHKMQVPSVAELVRLTLQHGTTSPQT